MTEIWQVCVNTPKTKEKPLYFDLFHEDGLLVLGRLIVLGLFFQKCGH